MIEKNRQFVNDFLKKNIKNQKIRNNYVYKIEDVKNWCNRNYIDLEQYIKDNGLTDEFLLEIVCNI